MKTIKNYQPLIQLALGLLLMTALMATLSMSAVFAEGEEEEDPVVTPPPAVANYRVVVKVTLDGEPVEGIDLRIEGPGIQQTQTTGLSDTVFSSLSEGNFSVTITLPSGELELASSSARTQSANLTPTNQEATIVYFLRRGEPEVDEVEQKLSSFNMPEKLRKVGSVTTDISALSRDRLTAIQNFTFDNPGRNRIIFLDTINLSDVSALDRLSLLSDNIDLDVIGRVRFETDLITPFANKRAQILMNNIRLVALPEAATDDRVALIHRNGQEYPVQEVSYDASNNRLSFNVDRFSTYTIAPRIFTELELSEADEDQASDDEGAVFLDRELDDEGEPIASYNTNAGLVSLTVYTDNLDATYNITNNGSEIEFPANPGDSGQAVAELELESGTNRVRIDAELENGESTREVITIEADIEADEISNNISTLFGVLFFAIVLVSGVVAGGVYYKKYYKKNGGKKSTKPGDNQEQSVKYDDNLLTEEERLVYNKTIVDDKSTVDTDATEETKRDSERVGSPRE